MTRVIRVIRGSDFGCGLAALCLCGYCLRRSSIKLESGGQVMSGYRVPIPINDPVRGYEPGSPDRQALKKKLAVMSGEKIEIPLWIGGKEVRTGDIGTQVMPHRHEQVIATWHKAG